MVGTRSRSLDELRPALVDALVTWPCFLVQVELYEDHLLLRTAPSALRVFVARVKERFDYGAACVHCELLRILAEVESTGVDGAQGVTDSYRKRLHTGPKFVAVFRPRSPAGWWVWGRDAAARILPRGLCAQHTPAPNP
jgi:hypothetical protein